MMSTNTPAPATNPTTPEKVFVPIPKAGPGQGYKAPKNYQQPALQALSRIIIVLLCVSLPLVPAGIITMILVKSPDLWWLFIPLGVLVEAFAIFVAIGIGREAIGSAGSDRFTR